MPKGFFVLKKYLIVLSIEQRTKTLRQLAFLFLHRFITIKYFSETANYSVIWNKKLSGNLESFFVLKKYLIVLSIEQRTKTLRQLAFLFLHRYITIKYFSDASCARAH